MVLSSSDKQTKTQSSVESQTSDKKNSSKVKVKVAASETGSPTGVTSDAMSDAMQSSSAVKTSAKSTDTKSLSNDDMSDKLEQAMSRTLDLSKSQNVKKSVDQSTTNSQLQQCKSKRSIAGGGGYGTGRRKNAVARVWVKPGTGKIIVNKKNYQDYFARAAYRNAISKVFVETNTSNQFDVTCTTKGGGTTGQAGAIVHGIARALDCISEDYHAILRQNGFLTRDSRAVERKKYGRRKARKKAQFSKR